MGRFGIGCHRIRDSLPDRCSWPPAPPGARAPVAGPPATPGDPLPVNDFDRPSPIPPLGGGSQLDYTHPPQSLRYWGFAHVVFSGRRDCQRPYPLSLLSFLPELALLKASKSSLYEWYRANLFVRKQWWFQRGKFFRSTGLSLAR